jgi:hypothetical protein
LELIRRAARGLRRAPGFTALCVLTLAVAIGAETAVFSIVDAVLLRPLPYQRPERLVAVWHTLPGLGLKEVGESDAVYLLYRAHRHALADLAIYPTAHEFLFSWRRPPGDPQGTKPGARGLLKASIGSPPHPLVPLPTLAGEGDAATPSSPCPQPFAAESFFLAAPLALVLFELGRGAGPVGLEQA